jgi:hypothetical protein
VLSAEEAAEEKHEAACIHDTLVQSKTTCNGNVGHRQIFFIFHGKVVHGWCPWLVSMAGVHGWCPWLRIGAPPAIRNCGTPAQAVDIAGAGSYARLALRKNSDISSRPAVRSPARAILTDIQFWAPFVVLLAGLALLIELH